MRKYRRPWPNKTVLAATSRARAKLISPVRGTAGEVVNRWILIPESITASQPSILDGQTFNESSARQDQARLRPFQARHGNLHVIQLRLHLSDLFVHSLTPLVHFFEALSHLFKTLVNPVEAPIHFVERFVHTTNHPRQASETAAADRY